MVPAFPPQAQKTQVAYVVAKDFSSDGSTSLQLSRDLGPTKMLRLWHAFKLYAYENERNIIRDLESARPVGTAMKAIVLRDCSLSDVLIKDGNRWYVEIREGINTERIQIANRLLICDILSKKSQIIKAESGWITSGSETRMLEENDQVSIDLPKSGSSNLCEIQIQKFLFNNAELHNAKFKKEFLLECGNLTINISYQNKPVAGGLVSVGRGQDHYSFEYRSHILIVPGLSSPLGALIYDTSTGTIASEEKTQVKIEPKRTANTPAQDMVTLVKNAKSALALEATKLTDGARDHLQKLIDEVERRLRG
jgi:hypothetical protein